MALTTTSKILLYHGLYLIVLSLAILYDHLIMYMYVGLFGHSAVVFQVFMFY